MIDLCTQFPDAVPLKDIHTSMVAEALIGIFSRVGIPRRIHSDRGSQFTSEMMSEVSRLLSIQQSTTSPYHAMGNGVVENFNKTMKNMLKKVAAERHRYLTPLMFAVWDTPQDSTGFTPFELLYGRSVRTPKNYGQGKWKTKRMFQRINTLLTWKNELKTCALAKEQLAETQKKNQKYYNRRARNRESQQGDLHL